jgi:chromosome segregation ATPase
MPSLAEALGTVNQYKRAVTEALSAADTIATVLQQGLDVQREVQALTATRDSLRDEIAALEARIRELTAQRNELDRRVRALAEGLAALRGL